jgi:hypothetical protein
MKRFFAAAVVCILAAAPAAQAAPRQGVDAPEGAAGNPDKIVCKRFTRIGSLVDGYRTCKTKKEWQRERDNLRQVNISDSCATRGQIGGSVSPIPGNQNTFDC